MLVTRFEVLKKYKNNSDLFFLIRVRRLFVQELFSKNNILKYEKSFKQFTITAFLRRTSRQMLCRM